MAEAFAGYVLPWGQMSYWGAQVIISLFGAIPVIGPDLVIWIQGDYIQRDDHLRAPVAHLAPRQHVARERLGHQAQEDQAAENPDQLARFAVRAVHQAAVHVQVHDDEERRGARRMQLADDVAPGHVAHDVLPRVRVGSGRFRLG